MAALVVQSRFAGLKIEDDDYPSSSEGQKAKKSKPTSAKKSEPPKKNNKVNNKSQTVTKKKKGRPVPANAEQWEQWKQKDEELVDGNYETELHQAILLSKLDYEEKKDVYKQFKKDADVEKKLKQEEQVKSGKKQKKKNVMSLDQFNDMVSGEDIKNNHEEEKPVDAHRSPQKDDTEFFERVKDDTKTELLKDKIADRVRHRLAVPDGVISRVQFADALEKKQQEIASLKEEVISLKQELLTVKSRNKKLCNILGQGEMKDKAEVLVEVERLRLAQAELAGELAALHVTLQQERSRHSAGAAPDPRAKDKKKKGANTEKEK